MYIYIYMFIDTFFARIQTNTVIHRMQTSSMCKALRLPMRGSSCARCIFHQTAREWLSHQDFSRGDLHQFLCWEWSFLFIDAMACIFVVTSSSGTETVASLKEMVATCNCSPFSLHMCASWGVAPHPHRRHQPDILATWSVIPVWSLVCWRPNLHITQCWYATSLSCNSQTNKPNRPTSWVKWAMKFPWKTLKNKASFSPEKPSGFSYCHQAFCLSKYTLPPLHHFEKRSPAEFERNVYQNV